MDGELFVCTSDPFLVFCCRRTHPLFPPQTTTATWRVGTSSSLDDYQTDANLHVVPPVSPSANPAFSPISLLPFKLVQGFILVAAVLVMIMAPGVGLLCTLPFLHPNCSAELTFSLFFADSGLLRRKSALSMLFLSFMVFSMAAVHWFMFGYSLAFSASGNAFIGDFANGGLVNVDIAPSGKLPTLLFAFYQSMFAGVTQVIVVGGAAERARIGPVLLWLFLWAT